MTARGQRVAVTGVGIVSALGGSAMETWSRLCAGETGIGPVTLFDVSGQRSGLAAEVKPMDPGLVPAAGVDAWSRTDVMVVLAAQSALAHAGLRDPGSDLALAVGGTTGGMLEAEGVFLGDSGLAPEQAARRLLSYPLSTPLERLATELRTRGRSASVCSACSSGANAILLGAGWIEHGHASRALVGGADALCRLTFTGFDALGVLSPMACRPFDVARSGLTLGEGAAFLLLESAASAEDRGATILAWLDGWAVGAEAHHITHPEPQGIGAARLIERALSRGGVAVSELDYVNAHGTATLQNDAAEARALASALGDELGRIHVSSSKGQIGHTLGASGAIEAALTVLAVAEGLMPPTGGLETPDPALGIRHVIGRAQPARLRTALSTSFGFGGAGTVLLLSSSDRPRPDRARRGSTLRVSSVVTLVGGALAQDAEIATRPSRSSSSTEREPLVERLDATRSRRFDRASSLVTLGAAAVAGGLHGALSAVGLVAGSAFGNIERTVDFQRRVFERGPRFASPADFPHLVPSAPAFNASIYLGLQGPVMSNADLATSAESALCIALALLEGEQADAIIAGSAEPHDRVAERVLAPLHLAGADATEPRGEGASFALLTRGGAAGDPVVSFWSDAARPEDLPAPRPERARAFCMPGSQTFVAASSWRDVPLEAPSFAGVPPEARGGFGFARAVASLLAGEAEQALWVSTGRGHTYSFVIEVQATKP
jgi:3-oxoacyl-[acyl-carrier-protein] synthase II